MSQGVTNTIPSPEIGHQNMDESLAMASDQEHDPADEELSLPLYPVKLFPDEYFEVDTDNPIPDSEAIVEELGLFGDVVASIRAGDRDFYLVNAIRRNGLDRFLLTDGSKEDDGVTTRFLDIDRGYGYEIGRRTFTDTFDYTNNVSRQHFEVLHGNGNLIVHNQNPKYPTSITAVREGSGLSQAAQTRTIRDDFTMVGRARVGSEVVTVPDSYAEQGVSMIPAFVIGRETAIDGGVYLGKWHREAIVVDGDSEIIQGITGDVKNYLDDLLSAGFDISENDVLTTVVSYVQNAIPYDAAREQQISRPYHGDRPINLSDYIEKGAGVCRHQALLVGVICESLIDDDYLQGRITIERSYVKGDRAGHARATLYHAVGNEDDAIVADASSGYVGTKREALHRGIHNYYLDEDAYRQAMAEAGR